MDKQLLVKDILFVAMNWQRRRQKAEQKLMGLLAAFPQCVVCGSDHTGADLFWVVEEETTGLLIRQTKQDAFSVCSFKCLFDHGLKKKAFYTVVARLVSGEVLVTGFQGRNAVAINEFALELDKAGLGADL